MIRRLSLRGVLFAGVMIALAVTIAVLSRKSSPLPPPFPAKSPAIRPGKVRPQIEVTSGLAIMVAPDGTLWTWGSKHYSHLLSSDTPVPRQVGTNSDWAQIACGWTTFALALKSDGSLWGWGATNAGQLGKSAKVSATTVRRVHEGTKWAVVRAGASHAIGLKRDGSLWGWGQNESGQVGDGSTSNRFEPALVSNDRDWKQIDAGHFNSFGLRSNGTLWVWGLNVPSQSGSNQLAPTRVDAETNWSTVSAGDYHVVGLKMDGTLWLRGQNAHIAASGSVTNPGPQFRQVGVDSDWSEIFSGANSFYARKTNGTWWVCGQNHSGSLGIGHRQSVATPTPLPFGFEPWAFDVGGTSAAILLGDGTLWTCGERMGAPKKTIPFKRVRDLANRVTSAIGLGRVFNVWEQTMSDESPMKIWTLPDSGP